MIRRTTMLVGAVALVLMLPNCSSQASRSASSSTVPSTTIMTSTTNTPPPTTMAAKATRGDQSSAQAAAELVSAWENHNKAAAAQIADAEAVSGIFATPDTSMWIRGCTTDDSIAQGGCVYRTETGLVQINTEHRPIGWVVTSAAFDRIDDGGLPSDSGNTPASPPPTTQPPTSSTALAR